MPLPNPRPARLARIATFEGYVSSALVHGRIGASYSRHVGGSGKSLIEPLANASPPGDSRQMCHPHPAPSGQNDYRHQDRPNWLHATPSRLAAPFSGLKRTQDFSRYDLLRDT